MDIATIVGLISGILLLSLSIFLGGDVAIFVNIPALIIVFGGTLAATLINFPLSEVLRVFNTLKNAFMYRSKSVEALIGQLVEFSTIARREGILALEGYSEEVDDRFLQQGILLAVDGASPELIRDILSTEVDATEDRHAMGQSIMSSMATFAPGFGLIGTLIGLIKMLTALDNPAAIGSGMAIALLTTLYGAILANLFFLPAAGKLRVRTEMELLQKAIIIEGILAIQSGDNPRVVEQKLKAFVAPAQRERILAR